MRGGLDENCFRLRLFYTVHCLGSRSGGVGNARTGGFLVAGDCESRGINLHLTKQRVAGILQVNSSSVPASYWWVGPHPRLDCRMLIFTNLRDC